MYDVANVPLSGCSGVPPSRHLSNYCGGTEKLLYIVMIHPRFSSDALRPVNPKLTEHYSWGQTTLFQKR